MKDDRSSRHKGKHSLSVSHTREGGKAALAEDLRGSHTAKDRTGRWQREGVTGHTGEGEQSSEGFLSHFREAKHKGQVCRGVFKVSLKLQTTVFVV